jgi:sulfite oxidase
LHFFPVPLCFLIPPRMRRTSLAAAAAASTAGLYLNSRERARVARADRLAAVSPAHAEALQNGGKLAGHSDAFAALARVSVACAAYLSGKFPKTVRNLPLSPVSHMATPAIARADVPEFDPGEFDDRLPTFKLSEVQKHTADSPDGTWVIFKSGVFDVTKFLPDHPGGERLLLAAGKSVEPFWAVFQAHHSEHVYKILQSLRVGNLDPDDAKKLAHNTRDANDPYSKDPIRSPLLVMRNEKPFCAEVEPSVLLEKWITPSDLHYVRCHMPVPNPSPAEYVLEVVVNGVSHELTLEELREKFPKYEVQATLQCIGNRAQALKKEKHVGTFFGTAISNSIWGGARLRDVLEWAGADMEQHIKLPPIDDDADDEDEDDEDDGNGNGNGSGSRPDAWIQFESLDHDGVEPFGGCIPWEKGMSETGDVLVAYEQNRAPITRDHGFPVRALVPGYAGVRNVKWLKKIVLSPDESPLSWWNHEVVAMGQRIMEWPVQSYIVEPVAGSVLNMSDGFVEVSGYAFAGGGRAIARVDLSTDGGQTWMPCDLERPDTPPYRTWAWSHWSCFLELDPDDLEEEDKLELTVRAYDVSFNTQPEHATMENFILFGCANNEWHRVMLHLNPDLEE